MDTTMTYLPVTSPSTIAAIRAMPLAPNDVFIASYPKSGTTWTQAIVAALLLQQGDSSGASALPYSHISDVAPFLDIDPHWDTSHFVGTSRTKEAHAAIGRRVFNTHMLYDTLPKGRSDARYIYVVRDGRDVCTSFYHHLSNQKGDAGTYDAGFDAFFDDWIDGRLPYGKWFSHLTNWADGAQSDERVLVVHYSEMLEDLASAVARIATHIGVPTLPTNCVDALTFAGMREKARLYQPVSVEWKEGYSFLRKGEVGDHARFFQAHQLERFKQACVTEWVVGAPACYEASIPKHLFGLVIVNV
ncbi:sulfotransferase [Pycnococcus provasolii]